MAGKHPTQVELAKDAVTNSDPIGNMSTLSLERSSTACLPNQQVLRRVQQVARISRAPSPKHQKGLVFG
jgi:hypothetical protein